MPTRKQAAKKPDPKPAHPDLEAGLKRLGLPASEGYVEDVKMHPIYGDVLCDLLAKTVPA